MLVKGEFARFEESIVLAVEFLSGCPIRSRIGGTPSMRRLNPRETVDGRASLWNALG